MEEIKYLVRHIGFAKAIIYSYSTIRSLNTFCPLQWNSPFWIWSFRLYSYSFLFFGILFLKRFNYVLLFLAYIDTALLLLYLYIIKEKAILRHLGTAIFVYFLGNTKST